VATGRAPGRLFAEKNKDAGRHRHKIEQKDRWPDVQAESQKAIEDQVNREQNHPNAFVEFHGVDFLDRLRG
jgi:hypothetical protein